MKPELVEKVAWALWNLDFHPDDVASREAARRITDWPNEWAKSKRRAIAAIEAMRPEIEREEREAVVAFLNCCGGELALKYAEWIEAGEHRSKP
jgi:hypothetical protein